MDYIPVFVAHGFYKNKTEFIDRHVVWKRMVKFPAVDRYLEAGYLVRLRNKLLVDMPIERHTTRHLKWVDCEFDADALERVTKKRWNVFENQPLRDVAEMFRVARKLVATDPSRLSSVRSLMEKHPRLIVFYNFDYELEELRTLMEESSSMDSTFPRSDSMESGTSGGVFPDLETSSPTKTPSTEPSPSHGPTYVSTERKPSSTSSGTSSDVIVAEWNGHRHDPVPTGERWVYLVQYLAGSEGWNCVTTDTMVFYSLTYSYKNWHQAFGRIDRLNTPFTDLHYYALVSKSWIDQAVMKALRAKKSFNESSFGRKMTW